MSAAMAGRDLLKISLLVRYSVRNSQICLGNSSPDSRSYATKSDRRGFPNPSIAVSDDGGTIMCWHPEIPTPYEHTKPIIRKEQDVTEGDSVLKVQLFHADKNRYEPEGPRKFELMNMFFTTKHRWFPQGSKVKKRRPSFAPPRESL